MPGLTKRGALAVSTDLDKLANLVETQFATLGIPKRIAADFSYRCDLLSDAIERTAIANAKRAAEEGDEEGDEDGDEPEADGEDKTAGEVPEAFKKQWDKNKDDKGDDDKKDDDKDDKKPDFLKKKEEESKKEAARKAHFDPASIAKEVSGPAEGDADESYMKGHFKQDWFEELEEKQESGDLASRASSGKADPKVASDLQTKIAEIVEARVRLREMARAAKALQARSAALERSIVAEEKKDEEPVEAEEDPVKKEAAEDERLLRMMLAEEAEKDKKDAEEIVDPKEEAPKKEASKKSSGYNLFA